MNEETPIIGQYNLQFRSILEYMNGKNFLSQGGPGRIDLMIGNINLQDKKVLDVGCGIGGPALHLAHQYRAEVYGVDVDPELIELAQKNKACSEHPDKLNFQLVEPNHLPFEDEYFDVVFSKESIVHSLHKERLFKELHRVLRPGRHLIIMDWFKEGSLVSDELTTTLKIDKLIMHYIDVKTYCGLLEDAGFKNLQVQETSALHLEDIEQECARLHAEEEAYTKIFGKDVFQNSLATWKAHRAILEGKELQTFLIKACR